ncbi:hypothetical protein A1Q2_06480 [Trichosporon asahii var. asahii CBS 8904]|uniref:Barwin domain-containing protein n=1 Tax=Trichosporon asahii var. asahii (strain CBS 8904) TaxID=1220162 RepID=K1VEL4_TRIAC|nr:hypothetical protein A1Q2_06480 [Trichosporon asahii var. asahii CBS 8904]
MYASLLTIALAASSVAAAPLQARDYANKNDNLEDYAQYHTRYLASSCPDKHNDQTGFFQDCCRPLKKGDLESVGGDVEKWYKNNGKDRCWPGAEAIAAAEERVKKNDSKSSAVPSASSASAPAATSDAAQPGDNAGAEYFDAGASSSAAPSSTSTEAPKPSPTEEAKKEEPKQEENKGNQGGGTVRTGIATHFTPWDGTKQKMGGDAMDDPHCGSGYTWDIYGGLQGNWVALESSLYKEPGVSSDGVSAYCGRTVRITSKTTGATVEAAILDSCPSCHKQGDIDVSPNVFNQLQNIVTIPFDSDEQPDNDPGELEVEWQILG